MPSLSFIYPYALWLLLLLVPLWVLMWFAARQRTLRTWLTTGIRSVIVGALVLSVAGAQLVFPVQQVTTVFLIDSSDSVSPTARSLAEAYIQDALDTKADDDQAAVVVFGEQALVDRAPNTEPNLRRVWSEPEPDATNIEEAVQLGMALLPAETQKRLVLLSDGGENEGDALRAAQLAASRDIPIEFVDLGTTLAGGEALVAGLRVPDSVRDGQEMPLVAVVESNQPQRATMRIFADQDVVFEEQVELDVGVNEIPVRVMANGQGFHRYRVQIEPELDARVQNNESSALVYIQGPPRVLLVANSTDDVANLAAALQATGVAADVVAPASMPADLAGLSAYGAIALVNVPARDLPPSTVAAMPGYVRDLGKGLVMIGGNESFGVGGYRDTPIEEALPVYMDVRSREERPDIAILFVIDKSGSMDSCHCSGPDAQSDPFGAGGQRKIDIAKEAVVQASAVLTEQDTMGVVAFDNRAEWIIPVSQNVSEDEVAAAVAEMAPNGDTNVRAGLQAAEDQLAETDARIKHVILLTDGWGHGGSNEDIARRMRDAGITLSVVAAGSGSASYLETLAQEGGGRYYAAENMGTVPEIFLQETILAAGNYIVEGAFTPQIVGDVPALDTSGGVPQLYGYNGSTLKDAARSDLLTGDGTPLLARWQYGLGSSIAWTSDMAGRWGSEWVQWEQFPRFAASLVDQVLPTVSNDMLDTTVEVDGGRTIITAQTTDGTPAGSDMRLTATLLPGGPNSDDEGDTELPTIELEQVAPGQYRAALDSPTPGSYFVQLQGTQDGNPVMQHLAGLVVPYSTEYRNDQSNPALLAELGDVTGGTDIADHPDRAFAATDAAVVQAQEISLPLLLLALLLLPLDIAVRRLFPFWRGTPSAGVPARAATPPAPAAAPPPAPPAVKTSPPTAVTPPPAASPPADEAQDPLERLRAAKERARRRVKGDE